MLNINQDKPTKFRCSVDVQGDTIDKCRARLFIQAEKTSLYLMVL